jgi:hypothetical protein
MEKYILIFDKGEQVGIEKIDSIIEKEDVQMEVLKAFVKGEEVDVLHVKDLDYGIVIPRHVADRLRELVNDINGKEILNER